jgi:preprotein translocase subunit SecF
MKKIDIKKQTNWLKYTKVYFLVSAIFIVAGVFAILSWGLPLGLDFTGGAVIDYRVEDNARIDEIKQKFEEHEIEVEQIQISEERVSVRTKSLDSEKQQETATISEELSVERVQLQNVGPTIGPELVKKTLYAILIAAGAILMWVAVQFKKWAFGTSAILAMIHDSLILIGSFSILGHFFDAEIDFLFVTAVLTTLSFSVHDTIVVFDRIREITKKHGGELEAVANRAVTETMRRSIINSLTIIIMLLALTIFGGATIRWFTVALLIGAIAGTYSSPFIAIPLYVYLTKLQKRIKKR